jgi:hypothetical protein
MAFFSVCQILASAGAQQNKFFFLRVFSVFFARSLSSQLPITAMPSYKTAYSGYAVEYSPFEGDKMAVATAQHFGIVGNGRQYVLQYNRDIDYNQTDATGRPV